MGDTQVLGHFGARVTASSYPVHPSSAAAYVSVGVGASVGVGVGVSMVSGLCGTRYLCLAGTWDVAEYCSAQPVEHRSALEFIIRPTRGWRSQNCYGIPTIRFRVSTDRLRKFVNRPVLDYWRTAACTIRACGQGWVRRLRQDLYKS